MTSPEYGESALGQELNIGVNVLVADVFLRSRLSLQDTMYALVSLSRLHTPDEEISLDINPTDDGGNIISFSENRRILDSDEEIFELGLFIALRLRQDGHGLRFNYQERDEPMMLTEAAGYILRRLPDFDGAAATIEVLVPEAQ